jgi:hypothetical protein
LFADTSSSPGVLLYFTFSLASFISNTHIFCGQLFLLCVQVYRICFSSLVVAHIKISMILNVCMHVYSRGGPKTAPAPRPSLIYCAFPYT